MSFEPIFKAAAQLGQRLARDNAMVVCAESCTGGLIAMSLTQTAGSSAWFDRGFVTYSNQAKQQLLGVPALLIAEHGAVSEAVALAMARGALERSGANSSSGPTVLLALAVTGIAGPGGAVAGKPVGTVCFGFAWAGGGVAMTRIWTGDRNLVRQKSALFSLQEGQRLWLKNHEPIALQGTEAIQTA
jgi:nicotinamide-nucleotide amidase